MIPTPSPLLTWTFTALVVAFCAAVAAGSWSAGRRSGETPRTNRRRTLATAGVLAGWLAVTAGVAASGVLLEFDRRPPPFFMLVALSVVLTVTVAFSPAGARFARGLPFAALVGSQVFRLPLELIMHRAYTEGVMPVQMSYSGRNFDILTGVTAGLLGIALIVRPLPRWVLAAWNLAGFALLVNIVTVAVLSTPTFGYFDSEPLNVWVAYVPFVWLPAVLVQAALMGHLLVLRKLLSAEPLSQTRQTSSARKSPLDPLS